MPGIRLTLARETLQVFVRHPPPWSVTYNILGILRVVDATGACIVDSQLMYTTCYLIWEMYKYVAPSRGSDRALPRIFIEYPLPWQYREIYAAPGPRIMVTASSGKPINCASGLLTTYLQDLERLVVAKHSSQRRGL